MTISSPEREAKKVKIAVDRNPVETSFEKWACDLKIRCEFTSLYQNENGSDEHDNFFCFYALRIRSF
jgi:hypothetical protein